METQCNLLQKEIESKQKEIEEINNFITNTASIIALVSYWATKDNLQEELNDKLDKLRIIGKG